MKNYLSRRNDNDFGFNFFEDALSEFFAPTAFERTSNVMKTDVKELENTYELSVDMPGFEKSDINLSLDRGYLTISAKREEKSEKEGNFLRRERSYSCSRSYYVGENIDENDVKAKYVNGTLTLSVPKEKQEKISKRNIEIE